MHAFIATIQPDKVVRWCPDGDVLRRFFMAALWNRAYFCPVVSSIFFLFPRLIAAVAEWMSAILPHMVWPLCEFKMQV